MGVNPLVPSALAYSLSCIVFTVPAFTVSACHEQACKDQAAFPAGPISIAKMDRLRTAAASFAKFISAIQSGTNVPSVLLTLNVGDVICNEA